MITDYNPIASQYKRAKQQPWRTYIEAHTLMELIGDPTNQSVVDLACGEGFYSRMIGLRGAKKVFGVDLSQGMIDSARAQESSHPLGIEYGVGDARSLTLPAEYDLAIAAYLLNYARDAAELTAMCRSIAGCLRPGGRFVGVNTNPAIDFRFTPSFRKYGFEISVGGEWREGVPITFQFFLDDGSFEIENYYLSVKTHEDACHAAGFREIRWHQPVLSAEGRARFEPGFWDVFLQHPPVLFMECLK
jgi:SAM-dependent methyltransferase